MLRMITPYNETDFIESIKEINIKKKEIVGTDMMSNSMLEELHIKRDTKYAQMVET